MESKNEGSGAPPVPADIPAVPEVKKPIQVVAIAPGYYDHRRIEPGQKFNLKSDEEFSKNWMQDLSKRLPLPEKEKKADKKSAQ